MRGTRVPGSSLYRRDLLHRIELLCRSGAGLQAIASSFCKAVRDLLGAASASVFWLSPEGEPLGFFHDSAPAEIKDFFIVNLEEMFLHTEVVSMASLTAPEGPLIGKMLDPKLQQAFWQGNIYRHLCVPLGHHHMLDMRAEVPGVGRAGCYLWNPADEPFTVKHAETLAPIQPLMHRALATPTANVAWRSTTSGNAHIITSENGMEMLVINDEAERLLMGSHLLRQNFAMIDQPRQSPAFLTQLARMLGSARTAELRLPVADGQLVARATPTRFLQGDDRDHTQMFVALDLQVADAVSGIDYVMELPVTRLQREILLYAMHGGDRSDCAEQLGIGIEAMKKHLRIIYNATGASRWLELQGIPATIASLARCI